MPGKVRSTKVKLGKRILQKTGKAFGTAVNAAANHNQRVKATFRNVSS